MSVPPALPDAPEEGPDGVDDGAPTAPRGGRVLRAFALVTVVSFVGLWGYVLYLAFIEGRQPPVDRLEDPTFALAAEGRCEAAVDEVDGLPPASDASTPEERAVVLDQANGIYETMLADLDDLTHLVTDDEEAGRVDAWLADWGTFLGDREDYADRLRAGEDSRMLVSEKPGEGRHITGWIDEFALANKMDSCVSPGDA